MYYQNPTAVSGYLSLLLKCKWQVQDKQKLKLCIGLLECKLFLSCLPKLHKQKQFPFLSERPGLYPPQGNEKRLYPHPSSVRQYR